MRWLTILPLAALLAAGCVETEPVQASAKPAPKEAMNDDKIPKSEEEWQTCLTPEQYRILREKGTERAFTGSLWNNKEEGTYRCAGCGTELFSSDTKFESGSGWPSFYKPVAESAVEKEVDRSHGMVREEVVCGKCGGHLGHVFDDGPKPTGLRYCINSAALKFEKKDK
jgi:peptide-methionine (R)-S-oxide reductase